MRAAARAAIACGDSAAVGARTATREADDAPEFDGVVVVTPPKSLRKFAVQLSWFSVAYVVHVVSTRRVRT